MFLFFTAGFFFVFMNMLRFNRLVLAKDVRLMALLSSYLHYLFKSFIIVSAPTLQVFKIRENV